MRFSSIIHNNDRKIQEGFSVRFDRGKDGVNRVLAIWRPEKTEGAQLLAEGSYIAWFREAFLF